MEKIEDPKKKQVSTNKKFLRLFWKLFGGGVVFVILIFAFANWGIFGAMPSFDELENPESSVATEIISADGKTLGKFYLENRVPIKFEELPQHLVDALIATEDERFYSHSGIDARGTMRAVFSAGSSGGASTITQQLAKNLFHGSSGSSNKLFRVIQKIKEWIIAVKLERQYTKNEIIAYYLNTVDFVSNAYGIRSAANIYFNKEPKNLTVEEAAVLIGMLQGPSRYNPRFNVERSQNRRNIVLAQMAKNNKITEAEKEKYQAKPLKINYTPETHTKGYATYFREYLRDYMRKWVKENPKKDGSSYDIYRDGLRIYTTIDSRMQEYAEEAVEMHLSNLQKEFFIQSKGNKNAPFIQINQAETKKIIDRAMRNSERWRQMSSQGKSEEDIIKSFDVKTKMAIFTWKGEKDTLMTPKDSIVYYKHFLQSGMMSMEPITGNVKAWVGGIDYKHFQYDHVAQGARQVGSTFKPFVYATAIDQLGMSPCDYIYDGPFTMPKGRYGIQQPWSPKNSAGKYYGSVTMKYALAQSLNTVTARLMDRVGPKAVIDLCRDLGVKSDIPASPAIALGAVEITVSDMVAAYSTFANQGVYVKPRFINKITDKNGVVLFESKVETRDVMNKDIAYAIVKLLEGVTEGGSGGRLRYTGGGGAGYHRMTGYPYAFKNPIAGKTGTTQNNSDGWFIGMVPNLVTGVWVGNEDRAAHFKSTVYGQGATMALPIWGIFMKKCYADKTLFVSDEDFERPANMSVLVDCWKRVSNDSVMGGGSNHEGSGKKDSLSPPKQSIIREFDF
ncbi:PBP1A family penicillin-binding protein [Flavobacterium sp. xlx-214]|uniref:penicillin-binding protein 1A n=1 Tax=unclassified Flavobacterium TaxID=196869 RepID=UPI0013D76C49|nr:MULTISPECIES: PBP1A family penicillin-binding protein [unclassified Flavobacterium]MBA5793567.1 PBP1A family penicillin-binding protein [Flavobacterium sp. xlx-221]QMI84497.1 PBP1A family penicillin-binding protein [Flavobacterium sp. xlx-214]